MEATAARSALFSSLGSQGLRFQRVARSQGCHACRIHSWLLAPAARQAEPTHMEGRGHGSRARRASSSLPCQTPSHRSLLKMWSLSHISLCCRHRRTSFPVLCLHRGLSNPPVCSPATTRSGHGRLPSQRLAREVKRGPKKK